MSVRRGIYTGVMVVCFLVGLRPTWCDAARARLERVVGTVAIQRHGIGPWITVTRSAQRDLNGNDHVYTYQRSKATIFIDDARVELGARTHIIIPPVRQRRATRGAAGIWAIAGKVFIWLIGARGMEIGTEGAIASAEGTKFLVEVEAGGITTLTVFEGKVTFSNDLGSVVVGTNEQSVAGPRLAPTRPMRVDPSGYMEWEATLDDMWLGWEMRYRPAESADRLQGFAAQAESAAAAAPTDVGAQIQAGDALNDAGELTAAEQAYRKALELDPQNVDAQLRLGFNLLQQARRTEAQVTFARATGAAPDNAYGLIGQAAAFASSSAPGNLARAEQALADALAMAPEHPLAHVLAGVLAMRQGQGGAAAAAFNRAIAADPSTYQAYAYLAIVQLASGDGEAALATAAKATQLAPGSGMAHESLATAEFFAGDLESARAQVAIALKANPASATAHLLASDVSVADGDLSGGEREAQLAVALDPLLAPAYRALGMIALAQNDLSYAEKAFARSLELSPNMVAARTGMGVTYARQGKLAAAMEMQKAAIALDSGRASTHNNLGAIYLALGDLEAAVEQFEIAIAAQLNWSMPRANLAIAYLDLNQFADAVHEGELAVRLGESSARVHTTLARVYLEQNRTNKAWASLRRALELDEDYALAHFQMAEVFVRQGRSRDAIKHQFEGITRQPSAMLESREYARTELRVEGGSFHGNIKKDGRGDDGQNSYYLNFAHEEDEWDRPHSDWETTSFVGIAGRQTGPRRTDAVLVNLQHEERDKPGVEQAGGLPEDGDYESVFSGREVQYLARRPVGDDGAVTWRVGYRDAKLADYNPDSMVADAKPFRALKLRYDGPMAEVKFDERLSRRSKLVAGVAVSGEDREVSGSVGMPTPGGPPGAITWTRFAENQDREAATFYLEHASKLDPKTDLMIGGRAVTARGMSPVFRPKASLRRSVGRDGTLVLLTRPVLRDDVSELSPVDDWALRGWLSPLDLGPGGFSQSYELQYQFMPVNGSLLRLSGFYRTLKNYIVDLEDPCWAPGAVGLVLGSGSLRGAEVEWEHWLGRDLSAGIYLRYTDSENDDAAGLEIPYQPGVSGQLRLDYIDRNGVRVGLGWLHIGERYADIANATRLGSYNVVNLSAAKQCGLQTDVFIRVENLFDQDYTFWQGYPDRGRNLRAGVEYRF